MVNKKEKENSVFLFSDMVVRLYCLKEGLDFSWEINCPNDWKIIKKTTFRKTSKKERVNIPICFFMVQDIKMDRELRNLITKINQS